MKAKIQKLAGLNQEVVELIKEEKMDDVVEKLAEIQVLTKEMDDEVEETAPENKEEIAKQETIAKESKEKLEKAMTELEKWSSLNIGADTIKDLISQFDELKDTITSWNDTINKLNERLEVVEKAKGISKQANEKIDKKSENVWGELGIL